MTLACQRRRHVSSAHWPASSGTCEPRTSSPGGEAQCLTAAVELDVSIMAHIVMVDTRKISKIVATRLRVEVSRVYFSGMGALLCESFRS